LLLANAEEKSMPYQGPARQALPQQPRSVRPSTAAMSTSKKPKSEPDAPLWKALLFLVAAPFLIITIPFIGMTAMALTAVAKILGLKTNGAEIFKAAAFIGIPLAIAVFIAANINNNGTNSRYRTPNSSFRASSPPRGLVWVNGYYRADGTF